MNAFWFVDVDGPAYTEVWFAAVNDRVVVSLQNRNGEVFAQFNVGVNDADGIRQVLALQFGDEVSE